MPQAIAGVIITELGLTGLSAIAVEIVVTVAFAAAVAKVVGKPKAPVGGADRNVTTRGTVEPRQIIYGEARAAGFVAFIGSAGNYNEYLAYVIALAGHQSEEISDIWLDGTYIPSADINASTGEVVGYYSGATPVLLIFKHLGAHNQTVDLSMDTAFTEWTSSHKGNGITYIVVAMVSDVNFFPNGAPYNIFAKVKGRRLYDQRLDSTNGGSGSHRYTDATTWAHSRNAWLCIRDYITGGSRTYSTSTPDKRLTIGEDDSRIDDAYGIAQANICDEAVAIPPASPATTQPRYTCDCVLSLGSTHRENLDIMLSSCAGSISTPGGKYRISVGAYNFPTITITADDIIGEVTVATHNVGEDTYNFFIPEFYDEDQNWSLTPGPARTQSSYQTADGNILPRTIELHATRNVYRAQRIAELHLELSRQQTRVVFAGLSPKAINIVQNELFYVTLAEWGWTNQAVRCERWAFMSESGLVRIEGTLESSSVWDDPAVGDYETPGTTGSEAQQIEAPAPPTGLTITSRPGAIQFDIDGVFDGDTIELWEHTSSTPFSSATKIAFGQHTTIVIPKGDTTTRYYWLTKKRYTQRSTHFPGSTSSPANVGIPGAARLVETADVDGDAITDTYYASESGPITSTALETIPAGGTADNKVVHSITFTPDADGELDVKVDMLVEATVTGTFAGSQPSTSVRVTQGGTTEVTLSRYLPVDAFIINSRSMTSGTISVTGGVSCTIALYVKHPGMSSIGTDSRTITFTSIEILAINKKK